MTLPVAQLEINQCLLCTSSQLTSYDEVEDTLVQELNRYLPKDILKFPPVLNKRKKCDHCDHIFLSPRLDNASIKKIYEYWYGYSYQSIFTSDELNRRRLKEFRQHHLKFLNQTQAPGRKLLDVGCGSGLFLHLAQQDCWQVTGIDIDPTAAKHGREQFGVPIRTGTIDKVLLAEDKFDVITLFDYLEHSITPDEDINKLLNHLNHNGLLIIRVPNQNSLQSKYMKENWIALIANHISYFSPDVMSEYLKKKGLMIEKIFAHNYQNQWDILMQRFCWARGKLAAKYLKKPTSSKPVVPHPTSSPGSVKKLMYSLFIEQLDHIGGWFNRGNNLMIIARKQ